MPNQIIQQIAGLVPPEQEARARHPRPADAARGDEPLAGIRTRVGSRRGVLPDGAVPVRLRRRRRSGGRVEEGAHAFAMGRARRGSKGQGAPGRLRRKVRRGSRVDGATRRLPVHEEDEMAVGRVLVGEGCCSSGGR